MFRTTVPIIHRSNIFVSHDGYGRSIAILGHGIIGVSIAKQATSDSVMLGIRCADDADLPIQQIFKVLITRQLRVGRRGHAAVTGHMNPSCRFFLNQRPCTFNISQLNNMIRTLNYRHMAICTSVLIHVLCINCRLNFYCCSSFTCCIVDFVVGSFLTKQSSKDRAMVFY